MPVYDTVINVTQKRSQCNLRHYLDPCLVVIRKTTKRLCLTYGRRDLGQTVTKSYVSGVDFLLP
jgi:hypothetical protein